MDFIDCIRNLEELYQNRMKNKLTQTIKNLREGGVAVENTDKKQLLKIIMQHLLAISLFFLGILVIAFFISMFNKDYDYET